MELSVERMYPEDSAVKGSISKAAWFCGLTEEMVQKERDEILNAQAEDIQALAPLIEAILSDEEICVVGSEPEVQKEKELFMNISPLING